ncbi:TEL2-interacting protein 1 like [Verticillium longisporum]|nr:TEL2-interacting protein 1 like [Verticillium longisporum]
MANVSPNPARNELFQQLKPCCVSISRIAIDPPKGATAIRQLVELTEELHGIISSQINRDASVIDDKLADYVFFPLSHVFRNQEGYPARLLEAALRCLTAITVHGWKGSISPQIVEQLLILLTFIVGGVPGQNDQHKSPEETTLEALRALTALITAAGTSATAAASLVDAKTIPALGHGVTVVIDSVASGRTPDIQLESLRALQAVFVSIKDHAALATLLPGVVSALAKLLSMPAHEKTRVLAAAITTLRLVLVAVVGDMKTRAISRETAANSEADNQKVLSRPWLNATVAQIKLALASVMRLRNSKAHEVRDALANLSLTLLDECHTTLENCSSILVESATMLEPEEDAPSTLTTSLQDLATIYPELAEVIKVTVYNWLTALPRIMQSAEEEKKQAAIRNVLKGTELVSRLQLDSSTLSDAVSMALRDSASSLLAGDGQKQVVQSVSSSLVPLSGKDLTRADSTAADYSLIVLGHESQITTRSELLRLISKVGSASQQVKLSLDMLDYSQELTDAAQVSSLWLSFELVKAAFTRTSDVDDYLDLSSVTTESEDPETALRELYAFSVSLIDASMENTDVDWRLEAVALEVVAYAASRSREAFRPELIDVFLFAVLKEVVEQGVRSDRLLLEGRQNGSSDHMKRRPRPTDINDIVAYLDRRAERKKLQQQDEEDSTVQGHPPRPWGPENEKQEEDDEAGGGEVEQEKPPKTPTYILLEKVATLTQHYLTSPTPALRKSLLDLLSTVAPALSADEDSFLPLINTVWPVVVARLYDAESFIVIAACDTLAILCATAGDFLASRIKTEWSDALHKWCQKKKQEALDNQSRQGQGQVRGKAALLHDVTSVHNVVVPARAGGTREMKTTIAKDISRSSPSSGGGLGRFASAAQTWEAVVRLLIAIVRHVRIEDEIYDGVLALLADRLGHDNDAREALEVVNADAVWFCLYERGAVEILPTPVMEGVTFPDMVQYGSRA